MHDIRTGLGVKNMSDLTIKNFLQNKKFKDKKHGLVMDLFTFLVILV